MLRRTIVACCLACAPLSAETVNIRVFGLFHTGALWVQPGSSQPLHIQKGASSVTLEGGRTAQFQLDGAAPALVTSISGGPAAFRLIIPGKIDRLFRGVLLISSSDRELTATIDMDLEIAVASVIAAESVPGAALEALKAQAVVARSFYTAARGRHRSFAFCDTTHCQFLRSSPGPGTTAHRAAEETRGLILTYQGRPFEALYSAACGGRTRALGSSGTYPYFAVDCDYCLRHPADPVRGHRLGMCQRGAAAMASNGASFPAILNHYYPGTSVAPWPAVTSQTPSKFTKKQSTASLGKVLLMKSAALLNSSE